MPLSPNDFTVPFPVPAMFTCSVAWDPPDIGLLGSVVLITSSRLVAPSPSSSILVFSAFNAICVLTSGSTTASPVAIAKITFRGDR